MERSFLFCRTRFSKQRRSRPFSFSDFRFVLILSFQRWITRKARGPRIHWKSAEKAVLALPEKSFPLRTFHCEGGRLKKENEREREREKERARAKREEEEKYINVHAVVNKSENEKIREVKREEGSKKKKERPISRSRVIIKKKKIMGWILASFFFSKIRRKWERKTRRGDNDVDENISSHEDDTTRLLKQCWTLSKIGISTDFRSPQAR